MVTPHVGPVRGPVTGPTPGPPLVVTLANLTAPGPTELANLRTGQGLPVPRKDSGTTGLHGARIMIVVPRTTDQAVAKARRGAKTHASVLTIEALTVTANEAMDGAAEDAPNCASSALHKEATMSSPLTSEDDRLTRLEELTFFQEERIKALDAALTAQQLQLDKLEQDFSDATSVIRLLREKLGDQPENSLPPHSMPERW